MAARSTTPKPAAAPKPETAPVPPPPDQDIPIVDVTDLPILTARQAMVAVMADVQVVAKTQRNEFGGWNFRGIDVTFNAVGPVMRKHGALLTPSVLKVKRSLQRTTQGKETMETLVKVKFSWYGTDGGDPITTKMWGEAMDSSDKGLAQAISAAERTYLINTLVIPTGDSDPDEQSHQRGGAAPAQGGQSSRGGNSRPSRPRTPAPQRETPGQLQARITQLSQGKTNEEIFAAVSTFMGTADPTQWTTEGLSKYVAQLEQERAQRVAPQAAPEEPAQLQQEPLPGESDIEAQERWQREEIAAHERELAEQEQNGAGA